MGRVQRSPGASAVLVCGMVLFCAAVSPVAKASCSGCRPNREEGRIVITQAACGSCHEIPGVLNANGLVGPPLARFGRRATVAGVLPNSPDNLAYWLRFPQKIVPGNAMPNTGLSESQAHDAAAYLESLR